MAKGVSLEEIDAVAGRLARAYPEIRRQKQREGVLDEAPLDSLLRTILSQNTTDVNRDRAFAALRQRFPTWDAAADASVEAFAAAIRETNYARTKAARMQHILRQLRAEQGTPTLDFLRDWPTPRVLDYLQHFPGVGAKSAAIVCLFALGRPVIPVDTHVFRVSSRLGWIPARTAVARAHRLLQALVPPPLIMPLHLGMWAHGHYTCRPHPRCVACVIYEFCVFPEKSAPMPAVEEALQRLGIEP